MILQRIRRRKAEPTTVAEQEAAQIRDRLADWRALTSAPRPDWPPQAKPLDADGFPDLNASDLDLDTLTAGLQQYGGLTLRDVITPQEAAGLRAKLDHILDLAESQKRGESVDVTEGGRAAWRTTLHDPATGRPAGPKWRWENRDFPGEAPIADSPHLALELIEMYRRVGLTQLVERYLGEPGAVSLQKWTMRRVPPTAYSSWHQDGNKLGGDAVRSVNVWIALSDCGVDAPGLDVIPLRLTEIVPTGTPGAYFTWDVAPDVVDQVREGRPVISPHFRVGDAFVFDHWLLHRTGVHENFTKDRYALETWFFAPSHFPEGYDGILV